MTTEAKRGYDQGENEADRVRAPIHPDEALADELSKLDLSAAELARMIDVPANRIPQIMAGKRNVTADTALRLGRYFGTSPDLWMNLHKAYALDIARTEVGAEIVSLSRQCPFQNLKGMQK